MPRFARVVVPQCPHHVTQRGNVRRDIFFTAADRLVYLGLLKQYAALYRLDVLGYCLMTNHVHLVVVPAADLSLAKAMREINMRYAQYRNAVEHGNGHLWQSRYYSCPVDPARLGSVMRYVELNPVRARLVPAAAQYEWSSARAHLGGHDTSHLLAQEEWKRCWTSEQWARILDREDEVSDHIREATYGGRPLGSSEFVEDLEKFLGRRLRKGSPGRPQNRPTTAVGDAGGMR